MNFFLSCDYFWKAVHEFLHLLFFFRTGCDWDMNDPDGGNWRLAADFLNTLNG